MPKSWLCPFIRTIRDPEISADLAIDDIEAATDCPIAA
jgi:hypothetical protein